MGLNSQRFGFLLFLVGLSVVSLADHASHADVQRLVRLDREFQRDEDNYFDDLAALVKRYTHHERPLNEIGRSSRYPLAARLEANTVLGRIGSASAVQTLTLALGDSDHLVKLWALADVSMLKSLRRLSPTQIRDIDNACFQMLSNRRFVNRSISWFGRGEPIHATDQVEALLPRFPTNSPGWKSCHVAFASILRHDSSATTREHVVAVMDRELASAKSDSDRDAIGQAWNAILAEAP